MNILFINTSRIWGGNEKWTHMAAHGLARRNKVFLAYRSSSLGERFSIKKTKLPFLNRLDFYSLHQLVKLLRVQKIQILVSTNRKFYLLGALAARLAGCRHFVRCGIVWQVPDNIYYRFLFKKIDGVIVNAWAVRDELAKSGPVQPGKIHLIYNGLDTTRLDRNDSSQPQKPYPFTIISCGEFIPRKGHDFLLRTFARFIKEHPASHAGLVLMGKGKQESELKHLTKQLGLEKYVTFTGFLDNPYPLMRHGDLFISVSQNEGISNSMLEAMYLGLPVIATLAGGGSSEIIRHGFNGFLVEQGDENQLVKLMKYIYQNRGTMLAKVGAEAAGTVSSRFSMQEMTVAMERAFAHTIKS